MANALGGTIWIGVGGGEAAESYCPVPIEHAENVCRAFSHAVRDRCLPRPFLRSNLVPAEGSGEYFVAITVEPFPGQPVAVKVKGLRKEFGGNVWYFPLRVGDQTVEITPENLPMYIDAKLRRVVIMLAKIHPGHDVAVISSRARRNRGWRWRLANLDVENNFVKFNHSSGEQLSFPLDDVETVFNDGGGWVVRYRDRG